MKNRKKNLIIYSTILFSFIIIIIIISYFKWKKNIALFLVRLCPDFYFLKKKWKKLLEWKKNSKASRTWKNACLIFFLCFSILILNKKKYKKIKILHFNKQKPPSLPFHTLPTFFPYTFLTMEKISKLDIKHFPPCAFFKKKT